VAQKKLGDSFGFLEQFNADAPCFEGFKMTFIHALRHLKHGGFIKPWRFHQIMRFGVSAACDFISSIQAL
jgi:hypothetical protein